MRRRNVTHQDLGAWECGPVVFASVRHGWYGLAASLVRFYKNGPPTWQ